MRIRFTDAEIRKLEPGEHPYIVREEGARGGLAIQVLPVRKSDPTARPTMNWCWTYKVDGKRRMLRLGKVGLMRLSDARAALRDAQARLDKGEDPATERDEDKAERRRQRELRQQGIELVDGRPTVNALARLYVEKHAKPNKRTWREDERQLEKDVMPEIGALPVEDVRLRDLVRVRDAVEKRGPIAANRMVALLMRMFRFAAERDMIDRSPAVNLSKVVEEERRDVTLTDKQLKATFKALGKSEMEAVLKDVFRVLLLTGQRVGEVAGTSWDEVDLDAGIWSIPGSRTKNGQAHDVPISTAHRAILERRRSDSPWVFPAIRPNRVKAGEGHIDTGSLGQALRRSADDDGRVLGVVKFRVHDLRRTVRTGFASLGVKPHIGEAILNHHVGGTGVARVYDRYDYRPEMAEALQLWADHLEGLVGHKLLVG